MPRKIIKIEFFESKEKPYCVSMPMVFIGYFSRVKKLYFADRNEAWRHVEKNHPNAAIAWHHKGEEIEMCYLLGLLEKLQCEARAGHEPQVSRLFKCSQ